MWLPSALKNWMFKRQLKKLLKSKVTPRHSISLEKAAQIGILFDATEPGNYVVVHNLEKKMQELGKKTMVLGYFHFKFVEGNPGHPYFCKKDLNWYGRPADIYQVRDFMDASFDILMNIFSEPLPPLEYISALSNARFRIGAHIPGYEHCNEVMIALEGTKGLQELAEQIFYYAKMIQTHDN